MKNYTSLFMCFFLVELTACSSQYKVTYNSDPEGAQLYCNGVAKGYTPVSLYYTLDENTEKRGYLIAEHCTVKWVSGATADAGNRFSLTQFPEGVIHTVPRPDVSGYSQDAEFALKVKAMEQNQGGGMTAQQRLDSILSPSKNTVQCKKVGDFLNPEIKTFQGIICPPGWFKF